MQVNMARGYTYSFDTIRKTEREKAIAQAEKTHKRILSQMERVRKGELRMVKTAILNGFTFRFEEV
jgi:hypothetical protein